MIPTVKDFLTVVFCIEVFLHFLEFSVRQLIVRPGVVQAWDEFLLTTAPYSIALDGYVVGPPQYEARGPRSNFNHHEDVDRLGMRSTCAQIFMAIQMGLFDRYTYRSKITMDIFVNDCDEDVCFSAFLLLCWPLLSTQAKQRVSEWVRVTDLLDTTSGLYPIGSTDKTELDTLKTLVWILEPYRTFRSEGGIERGIAEEYHHIISTVCDRIHDAAEAHHVPQSPLDTSYEVLHQGSGWTCVKETGPQARVGMMQNNIPVFISVTTIPTGGFKYSIGKKSIYIEPDFIELMSRLNDLEALHSTDKRPPWGGGDTIFGSPRVVGSCLTPSMVVWVVEKMCLEKEGLR